MKCRSLGPRSPLAGQLWGLWSNWLPLGMLLCVQWSNENEARAESIFPFFFSVVVVVVAVFSLHPSLLCVYCGRKNTQSPLLPVFHQTTPLSISVAASFFTSVLLLSLGITRCFSHFSYVFADNTLASVYISCSLHYTLSVHLSPLSCFFVGTIHSS